MAHQQVSIGLAMILATLLWAGVATAQSSDCTNVLISMSPCLNYISGNSSSTPSSACCSQLRTVVGSQPHCLCQLLSGGGGSNLGLNINQTQATALPGACNVQTPPPTQCNAASPADSPSSEPDSPNSGEGSKTVPTGDGSGSSSDASSNKLGVAVLFCLVFVSSYFTTSNMA